MSEPTRSPNMCVVPDKIDGRQRADKYDRTGRHATGRAVRDWTGPACDWTARPIRYGELARWRLAWVAVDPIVCL